MRRLWDWLNTPQLGVELTIERSADAPPVRDYNLDSAGRRRIGFEEFEKVELRLSELASSALDPDLAEVMAPLHWEQQPIRELQRIQHARHLRSCADSLREIAAELRRPEGRPDLSQGGDNASHGQN